MSHGQQYPTEQIISALEARKGAVTLAAEQLGCSYKTIERRAEQVQAVKDVIDKYRKRRVDVAELALDVALAKQEPWAVTFTLKTLGRDRGYVERAELTGADGGDLVIQIVRKNSSTDEDNRTLGPAG